MKTIYFAHDQQEAPTERKVTLEQAGFRVEQFSTASGLLSALDARRPDLVLLDVLVEGANGFALSDMIRDRTSDAPVPVVLCSRIYRQRSFREIAERVGCSAYVLMPTRSGELLRTIHDALDIQGPAEAGQAA